MALVTLYIFKCVDVPPTTRGIAEISVILQEQERVRHDFSVYGLLSICVYMAIYVLDDSDLPAVASHNVCPSLW